MGDCNGHIQTDSHRAYVWVISVAFSPDGRTIASGSYDNTVRLWDAVTGAYRQTFIGHTSFVHSIAFSPDGTVLLWGLSPTRKSPLLGDVNHDGVVNAQDLVIVAARFGQRKENDADVNGDGVVNIFDLVTVAGLLSNAASAL